MRKPNALALIATASPDLEKQSFSAVVFINREYSEEQEKAPEKSKTKENYLDSGNF